MTDLTSVAREAANELDGRLPGGSYADGWADCASRLPSEEELAEAMFVAYADETGKPFAEEGHGIRSLYLEQARAVRALIGEKISG